MTFRSLLSVLVLVSSTRLSLEDEFVVLGLLLELVPVVGPSFFCLGNACGAALWAIEIEKSKALKGDEQMLAGVDRTV